MAELELVEHDSMEDSAVRSYSGVVNQPGTNRYSIRCWTAVNLLYVWGFTQE